MAMRRKWWIWLIGAVAGLIIAAIAFGFLMDEPLRRYAEQQLNSRLQGYTIRLGRLDLHPLRFSVDLYDVTIMQDAHPEPPIVHVPRLHASLHWRALLTAHVVSDVLVERPNVHLNLQQVRQEATDDVPLQERGWQEAVQSVAPLKMNILQVVDGDIMYVDEGSFEPLRLSQLSLRAENIRNIR
jgi:uncharacterized protein involved in outer membrane biogenesis